MGQQARFWYTSYICKTSFIAASRGARSLILVLFSIDIHDLCIQAANDLANLLFWARYYEPSKLDNAIGNEFS